MDSAISSIATVPTYIPSGASGKAIDPKPIQTPIRETASTANATSKLFIAILGAFFVGGFTLVLLSTELINDLYTIPIVPVVAYGVSCLLSAAYQYSTCKKVISKSIFQSNAIVALTNLVICVILYAESFPILKYFFGPYAPRNPVTGLPYSPDSAEYGDGMASQDHYKISMFSGVVKEVLPPYYSNSMKQGFYYMYWVFWMTLLPHYFLLSLQSTCV